MFELIVRAGLGLQFVTWVVLLVLTDPLLASDSPSGVSSLENLQPDYKRNVELLPSYNVRLIGYSLIVEGEKVHANVPEIFVGDSCVITYFWECLNQFGDIGHLVARFWGYSIHYNGGLFPLESADFGSIQTIGKILKTDYAFRTGGMALGKYSIAVGGLTVDYDIRSLSSLNSRKLSTAGHFRIIERVR